MRGPDGGGQDDEQLGARLSGGAELLTARLGCRRDGWWSEGEAWRVVASSGVVGGGSVEKTVLVTDDVQLVPRLGDALVDANDKPHVVSRKR